MTRPNRLNVGRRPDSFELLPNLRKVGNELGVRRLTLLGVGSAQNRGRMERRSDSGRPFVRDKMSVLLGQAICPPQQRLSRGCAETNDHLGFDQIGFGSKPRIARRDFRSLWFFVNPPFAAFLEFEVLHGIGYINFSGIDAGIGQGASKHLAGRTDERMTLPVFLIAGLFSDQDQTRRRRSFAEHALRSETIKIATPAIMNGGLKLGQFTRVREKR